MQFPDTIHPSMESSVGNCCTAILVTILCFAFSRLLTHPYFAIYSALFVQSPTTLIAVHDRVVAIIIAPNCRLLARESLLVFPALYVDRALYMYYNLTSHCHRFFLVFNDAAKVWSRFSPHNTPNG